MTEERLPPAELLSKSGEVDVLRTVAEALMAVFHFIEGLCNRTRSHSALGYLSRIE
jgi:hypothetical protein